MDKIILLTLLVCLFFGPVYAAKPKLMDLRRGNYEIITHKAKGQKPYPLLVIVPSKKYGISGSLFEDLATAAAANGYFVVRFNWGFVTNRDKPSKDLSTEANDLKTVVNYFAGQKNVDSRRVLYVAKSFGAKVVMQKAYEKATGVVLLTPHCSAKELFSQTYGVIASKKVPTQIVISKDDPHCDVNHIYKSLGSLNKKYVTIHTLFGDHNFKTSKNEKKDLNRRLALDSVVNWLRQQ